jgi:hypothetical protein
MRIRLAILISVLSTVVTIVAIVALGFSTGIVTGQSQDPPIGDNGDGSPELVSPENSFEVTGPDAPESPSATFRYYTILGTALQPRTSSTTFAYDFDGCINITGGTDDRLMFPLLIQDGSIIKYLRIYYRDTSASNLTAWITQYDPGVTSTDLVSVTSTGNAGYGTALSAEITVTVNDGTNYTISVSTATTTSVTQICGIRIAYYAPSVFGSALPIIKR